MVMWSQSRLSVVPFIAIYLIFLLPWMIQCQENADTVSPNVLDDSNSTTSNNNVIATIDDVNSAEGEYLCIPPCEQGVCSMVNAGAIPSCICPIGFSGAQCEIELQACPCQNGGTCSEQSNSNIVNPTVCNCPFGTSGDFCEIVEELSSEQQEKDSGCELPCQNGGLCNLSENSQICQCSDGFAGALCEESIQLGDTINSTSNLCSLPCENNATCQIQENGSEKCICIDGTFGLLCEGTCKLECKNGGTCTILQADEQLLFEECQCPTGISGLQCEVIDNALVNEPGVSPPTEAPTERFVQTPIPTMENAGPDDSIDKNICDHVECMNGGTCDPNGAQPICRCPIDFTGAECEIYEGDTCGNDMCYNGSQCRRKSNGDLYCDCGTVNDGNTHYAGEFCEYEATTYCPNKSNFCVNGGQCRDEGKGQFSCFCPDQWTGPSCEFESQQVDEIEEVCSTITCLNGGRCKKGPKLHDSIKGLDPELEHFIGNIDGEKAERCVCPQGFTGKSCQYSYEECGNGEHMCLHGTKCVAPIENSNAKWTCACDEDSGQVCQQHKATECISPDSEQNVYRGLTSLILCVNDGECTTYEQNGRRYPACKCPAQFTGPHCEFLRTDFEIHNTVPSSSNDRSISPGGKFGIILLCLLVVAFASFFAYKKTRGQSSREKAAMVQAAHVEEMREESESMEEVDFADTLEDVELL